MTRRRVIVAVWAAGVGVACWLTPPGPRAVWKLPDDQHFLGVLSDARTIVTEPRFMAYTSDPGTLWQWPVRLWDVETNQVVASHRATVPNVLIRVISDQDLIVWRSSSGSDPPSEGHIHDARTWREIARLPPRDLSQMAGEGSRELPIDPDFVVSNDRATLAVETPPGIPRGVEWRETATGRAIYTLNGECKRFALSPDGQRLATEQSGTIIVADLTSGSVVSRIPNAKSPDVSFSFSPDNQLLLRGVAVFDVATSAERFCLPDYSAVFVAGGRELAVVLADRSGHRIAFFDTTTGRQLSERSVPLPKIGGDRYRLDATADGRWLLADGEGQRRYPTVVQQWIRRLLGLTVYDPREDCIAVVDAATGREVMRGNCNNCRLSADGRFLLSRERHDVWHQWDVPGRRPWRWLGVAAAGWTATYVVAAGLIVLVRFFVRRWARANV